MSERIDYDAVASSYDAQPHRAKSHDSQLEAFLQHSRVKRALDLACGTGSQIAANHARFPSIEYVGVDASAGMLQVARDKLPAARWLQASAESIPLQDRVIDYASCQFAYHHFSDPAAAFSEVARTLRPGGRFVLTNISPVDHRDSIFYRAFSGALDIDMRDFLTVETLRSTLRALGLTEVDFVRETAEEAGATLGAFRDYVAVRTNNSHLTAIADDQYRAGMDWIDRKIAMRGRDCPVRSYVVIVTLVCDRPAVPRGP